LILHLGNRVVRGDSFNPKVLLLEREAPTAAESLSQWSHLHDTESCSFQRVPQCHKEAFNLKPKLMTLRSIVQLRIVNALTTKPPLLSILVLLLLLIIITIIMFSMLITYVLPLPALLCAFLPNPGLRQSLRVRTGKETAAVWSQQRSVTGL
jgi:hypothetical protein